MRTILIGWGLLAATPLAAQTPPTPPGPPEILVSASGTARTPPDRATIAFTVRGEGTTSDEAARMLAERIKAVRAGSAALAGRGAERRSSQLSIREVRPRACDQNGYGAQRLSSGDCAIIGYVATTGEQLDTANVKDAGTLAGLIGRLGGSDVQLQRFWLADDSAARREATQKALAEARTQAELIATGSGARLGSLRRVQDGSYDYVVRANAIRPRVENAAPPPPPPPAPPPVSVDFTPGPIETTVRLSVSYAIAP
ncbi:SIMPL domain-containing protein [Sphingomonas aracearum]|uniref:DUF541 domain-containing protein n=1 Tax=Sphingomonas aracearum TaxID=2283317 RepID=A0A369W3S4_9SPHN|nr:SIMPL domain-containing protein [Sphingomonas aracearum]RDE06711.1 DUF541 domain-containing protein [Sphingomonas aracearum]